MADDLTHGPPQYPVPLANVVVAGHALVAACPRLSAGKGQISAQREATQLR